MRLSGKLFFVTSLRFDYGSLCFLGSGEIFYAGRPFLDDLHFDPSQIECLSDSKPLMQDFQPPSQSLSQKYDFSCLIFSVGQPTANQIRVFSSNLLMFSSGLGLISFLSLILSGISCEEG